MPSRELSYAAREEIGRKSKERTMFKPSEFSAPRKFGFLEGTGADEGNIVSA